eukprot:15456802-Alexandrium_andersonii.AAC.1
MPSPIGPDGPAGEAPTDAGPPRPTASPCAASPSGPTAACPGTRTPPIDELAAGAGARSTFTRA